MNYSIRFRLYTTLVAVIVLTILFFAIRALYNSIFDLNTAAVSISEIGAPPKDTLIAINSYFTNEDNPQKEMPSRLITLTGKIIRESATGGFQVIRLWNGDQYIVDESQQVSRGKNIYSPAWFTYSNETLVQVTLPTPCTQLYPQSAFEYLDGCNSYTPSLSPDAKQLLLQGTLSNQKNAERDIFGVIWNRENNTWETIYLSDLPVSDAIKNDADVEMLMEWEENKPDSLFIIVQKETPEHTKEQLARFVYSATEKKMTVYDSTEYGPLMVSNRDIADVLPMSDSVLQEQINTDSVLKSSFSSQYSYKYEGTLNPFTQRRIVLVNTETKKQIPLLKWRKIFSEDMVNVAVLDLQPETEWFAVVQNNHLFITRRGSDMHARIGDVPFTYPGDMQMYGIQIYFGQK